jgi:hypothetical protein
MNTRKEMTLQTIGEYAAFLSRMQASDTEMQYMNRVYTMLNEMGSGDRIVIDQIVAPSNLRKFIGCVCLYILDTNLAEFDSEYRTVKKLW